jgi:hypothetical protein
MSPVDTITEALQQAYKEVSGSLREDQERLQVVNDELERYQDLLAERARLEGRIASMTDEARGLELAIARRNGSAPAPEGPERSPSDWLSLTRAEAVERILREAGRALSPSEITDVLVANGRTDARKGVSVALMRMEARGLVRKGRRRGLWELPQEVIRTA